ncbi:hypothetical protein Pcinc_041828 [Petrolisthes cinctipes]|uniref:Uncharacterized protein n=1 Tax=Petrolisthes cinctipes TaxID=88211 RepID=A0AAE1EJE8_PETCI|nr:hypothetical protein Pcinc_041828 [Petrolisthes cinctipes]
MQAVVPQEVEECNEVCVLIDDFMRHATPTTLSHQTGPVPDGPVTIPHPCHSLLHYHHSQTTTTHLPLPCHSLLHYHHTHATPTHTTTTPMLLPSTLPPQPMPLPHYHHTPVTPSYTTTTPLPLPHNPPITPLPLHTTPPPHIPATPSYTITTPMPLPPTLPPHPATPFHTTTTLMPLPSTLLPPYHYHPHYIPATPTLPPPPHPSHPCHYYFPSPVPLYGSPPMLPVNPLYGSLSVFTALSNTV